MFVAGCDGGGSTRGLIGHWTFDELSSDGKMTPDSSGGEHAGRVYGQPLVEGVRGKAIRMEAFPEQVIDLEGLRFGAPATVSFWVWTRDLFHDRRVLSQVDEGADHTGSLRFDSGRFEVWDGSEWGLLIREGLRITQWMHIAVVYDSAGKTTGYLNGSRAYSVDCEGSFEGTNVAIGAPFYGRQGNVFSGRLDEFRIYNRALSEVEIIELVGGESAR
jgi:hypothetical protein